MKIKQYYSASKMSKKNKEEMNGLVKDCDFTIDMESVIDREREKSVFCIFDKRDNIFGFASVEKQDDSMYISGLYVKEGFRSKGYGSVLLEEVRRHAKKEGCDYVSLSVVLKNKGAQKLYLQRNFFYNYFDGENYIAGMKMFVSSKRFAYGAIIKDVASLYGKSNILKGLEDIKERGDYSQFYPYVRGKEKDECLKEIFESGILDETAKFILEVDSMDINKKLLMKELENGENFEDPIKKVFPVSTSLPKEDIKDICFAYKVYNSFEESGEIIDKIKEETKHREEKARVL